jgi:sulfatase maturation enzyme AslB (radical SAM superfamily)
METVIVAKILAREYSVVPTGFCDNDVRKQGKHLNSIPNLKMFSFDEALKDEKAEFLVISPHHSAAIIGTMVFEHKVASERIINFHPIERRKTCALFAQNWIIEDQAFVCCCIEEYKPRFDNQKLDPQKGITYLNKTRLGLINGDIPMPEGCMNCFNNKDSYIYASRRLNSFDFSFRGWCNYKCEYCSSNQPDLKGYNDKFSLEQYLIELEKQDMLNDIFSVLFAVGESCLNEKRFPLYDYCKERQYFLDVFTNCSVFDKSLFEVAQSSPVIIRKSFDAGTAETYARIKGVNCFPKMLENVRQYLTAPYLALNPKYLFVPGINDNEEDVNKFVQICAELRVDFVTPVFSFLDSQYFDSSHAKRMFKLLVDELAANGIFTANVDTLYSENYHKQYSESF